jgi:hypothetical protein
MDLAGRYIRWSRGSISSNQGRLKMEILIVVLLLGGIVWAAFKLRRHAGDSTDSVLADAWRVVLSDPNYEKRRPLEERKHAAERKADTLAETARNAS